MLKRIAGLSLGCRTKLSIGLVVAAAGGLAASGAAGYVTNPATIFTIAGTDRAACSASPCGDDGAAISATLLASTPIMGGFRAPAAPRASPLPAAPRR